MRSGQAMVETVIAVVVITFLFFALFQLSHLLTAKILADHAAARVARARAVGFNDFMCLKAARVAVIPVAGRLRWPQEGDCDEVARIPIYLSTYDEPLARGVLDYERWDSLKVAAEGGAGIASAAEATVGMTVWDEVDVSGEGRLESHFPLYMNDEGR